MRRALSLAWFCALVVGVPLPASAQDVGASVAEEPRAAPFERSAPQEHFARALVRYRAGRYRSAIGELRAALALDPRSKDLVYNLALVHEKLGELEQAVAVWQQYLSLEPDPTELSRAEQTITRLRGARAESLLHRPAPSPSAPARAPAPAPEQPARWDSWFLASSGLAAIAGVAGLVFGIRALVLHPGAGAKTGASRSIEDIRRDQRMAQQSALLADVSFGVSLGAGAAAAGLWFAREAQCGARTAAFAPVTVSWGAQF